LSLSFVALRLESEQRLPRAIALAHELFDPSLRRLELLPELGLVALRARERGRWRGARLLARFLELGHELQGEVLVVLDQPCDEVVVLVDQEGALARGGLLSVLEGLFQRADTILQDEL